MLATYERNDEHNGIEIKFTEKPDAATLDTLKAEGFRWHKARRVWYAKQTAERLTLAQQIAEGATPETTSEAAPSLHVDRAEIAAEYAKIWGEGTKMQKFCIGKVLTTATLDDGTLIIIDKQSIKKDFCFGESGYDYDDATKMAAHARTNQEYFKAKNLERFAEMLDDIADAKTLAGRYILTYHKTHYIGQPDDCKIGCIQFRRVCDVLNDNGGSAYLDELPGKVMHEAGSGAEYTIMTLSDVDKIESAYKAAYSAHEKRVNTYLKKYGLTQVHSWTYWRDA